MIESRISSRGRTTLPGAVRDALALQPGDRVRYIIQGGDVRIMAVRPRARLFGALRHGGPAMQLEHMEQAIADGASEAR